MVLFIAATQDSVGQKFGTSGAVVVFAVTFLGLLAWTTTETKQKEDERISATRGHHIGRDTGVLR